MMTGTRGFRRSRHVALAATAAIVLAGCEDFSQQFALKPSEERPALAGGTSLEFEERDIEAPEIFDVTDTAVWDGRPSFGGVWVAYPDISQAERVTITNKDNGKSVVGALFKSEKDNPGPSIRLSSDAARELGVIAGQPTTVSIVAIRRQPVQLAPTEPVALAAVEDIAETPIEEAVAVAETPAVAPVLADAPVETTVLTDTLAAAIEKAPKPRPEVAATDPEPAPTPAAPVSTIPAKPFVQVATLTSEANATALEKKLSDAGITSLTRVSTTSSGKDLFRVLAGPAVTADAMKELRARIAKLGFSDAFPVTN